MNHISMRMVRIFLIAASITPVMAQGLAITASASHSPGVRHRIAYADLTTEQIYTNGPLPNCAWFGLTLFGRPGRSVTQTCITPTGSLDSVLFERFDLVETSGSTYPRSITSASAGQQALDFVLSSSASTDLTGVLDLQLDGVDVGDGPPSTYTLEVKLDGVIVWAWNGSAMGISAGEEIPTRSVPLTVRPGIPHTISLESTLQRQFLAGRSGSASVSVTGHFRTMRTMMVRRHCASIYLDRACGGAARFSMDALVTSFQTLEFRKVVVTPQPFAPAVLVLGVRRARLPLPYGGCDLGASPDIVLTLPNFGALSIAVPPQLPRPVQLYAQGLVLQAFPTSCISGSEVYDVGVFQ